MRTDVFPLHFTSHNSSKPCNVSTLESEVERTPSNISLRRLNFPSTFSLRQFNPCLGNSLLVCWMSNDTYDNLTRRFIQQLVSSTFLEKLSQNCLCYATEAASQAWWFTILKAHLTEKNRWQKTRAWGHGLSQYSMLRRRRRPIGNETWYQRHWITIPVYIYVWTDDRSIPRQMVARYCTTALLLLYWLAWPMYLLVHHRLH